MSGYFARALDTRAPPATPVQRVRSPLARFDQRLNEPELAWIVPPVEPRATPEAEEGRGRATERAPSPASRPTGPRRTPSRRPPAADPAPEGAPPAPVDARSAPPDPRDLARTRAPDREAADVGGDSRAVEVEPARSRDAADGGSEAADARAPEDGPVGLPRETPEAIVEAFTVVERWIGAPTEARDGAPEVPALAAEPEQPAPLPQVPSVPAGDGAESVHEAERDAPDAAERPHPSPRLTIGAIHVEIVEREPEKRRRAEAPRARQPAAPVQRVPRESRPLRPFGWRQR